MGGPMSVNDELPWIPAALRLIHAAAEQGVPVLGHCLGAQLMSKALGGAVGPNPAKEIGWGRVDVPIARGARLVWRRAGFLAFHWHGETYTLRPGPSASRPARIAATRRSSWSRHWACNATWK